MYKRQTFLIVAATALIARRVTGSAWAGAGAAVVLAMVGDFSPFPGRYAISAFNEDFISFWDPLSPSLGYGLALMLLAVHVLLRVVGPGTVARGDAVLLVLAVLGLTGAKATCLPMIVCGIALVIAVTLWRRRPVRAALGSLVVALGGLAFAHVVLFRGASQGMWVEPFHLGAYVAGKIGVPAHGLPLVGATGLMVVSWACAWVGSAYLLRRDVDVRAVFLLGCAASGVGASLVLGHPHFSEDYFARFAQPFLAICAAWGLHVAVSRLPRRVRATILIGGAVVGVLVSLVARAAAPGLSATSRPSYADMAKPYALTLVAVAVLAVVAGYAARRRQVGSWQVAAALAAVVVTSLGLVRVVDTASEVAGRPWSKVAPASRASAAIGVGGLATADWLREHTSADDVLATNAHTRQPDSTDNRHAWISGLAERRMLLEGWAYTPPVLAEAARERVPTHHIGFYDSALLATNDAAFTAPSRATVGALRDRYGVRYLVVDTRYPADLAGLSAVADLRHRSGDYAVLEVRNTRTP